VLCVSFEKLNIAYNVVDVMIAPEALLCFC